MVYYENRKISCIGYYNGKRILRVRMVHPNVEKPEQIITLALLNAFTLAELGNKKLNELRRYADGEN